MEGCFTKPELGRAPGPAQTLGREGFRQGYSEHGALRLGIGPAQRGDGAFEGLQAAGRFCAIRARRRDRLQKIQPGFQPLGGGRRRLTALVAAELNSRQDLRAFNPHGLKLVRIQSQGRQDGGCDLLRIHLRSHGTGVEARI